MSSMYQAQKASYTPTPSYSAPTYSAPSYSTPSSYSSAGGGGGMSWNAFQHSVGGQGYSRAQISEMYRAQKR